MTKRLTHLYFGDGKGKTTAAMGLAVRALGNGWRVVVAQFLKGTATGEIASLETLGATVLRGQACTKFVMQMTPQEKEETRAGHDRLLRQALELVERQQVDLLILDELSSACSLDMVDEALAKQLVEQKPDTVEMVITAHQPAPWMLEAADYATEMACRKHPYQQGIPARKGVEF